MKLWIRNMWKNGLFEVNGVVAMESGDKWQITDSRYVLPLGEYATRERCLEIIDEIHKLLGLGNPENAFMHIHNCGMPYNDVVELFNRVRQNKAIVTDGADFSVIMPSVITYEMPEE